MSPAEMKEAYQRCKLGQAAAEQLSQPPERTEQGAACNLRRYMISSWLWSHLCQFPDPLANPSPGSPGAGSSTAAEIDHWLGWLNLHRHESNVHWLEVS